MGNEAKSSKLSASGGAPSPARGGFTACTKTGIHRYTGLVNQYTTLKISLPGVTGILDVISQH